MKRPILLLTLDPDWLELKDPTKDIPHSKLLYILEIGPDFGAEMYKFSKKNLSYLVDWSRAISSESYYAIVIEDEKLVGKFLFTRVEEEDGTELDGIFLAVRGKRKPVPYTNATEITNILYEIATNL